MTPRRKAKKIEEDRKQEERDRNESVLKSALANLKSSNLTLTEQQKQQKMARATKGDDELKVEKIYERNMKKSTNLKKSTKESKEFHNMKLNKKQESWKIFSEMKPTKPLSTNGREDQENFENVQQENQPIISSLAMDGPARPPRANFGKKSDWSAGEILEANGRTEAALRKF